MFKIFRETCSRLSPVTNLECSNCCAYYLQIHYFNSIALKKLNAVTAIFITYIYITFTQRVELIKNSQKGVSEILLYLQILQFVHVRSDVNVFTSRQ